MVDTAYTYKIHKERGVTPVFVATIVANEPNKVEFFCPYCTKYHRHGFGADNFEGHRSAHCTGTTPLSKTGYYLVAEKRSRSKILLRS